MDSNVVQFLTEVYNYNNRKENEVKKYFIIVATTLSLCKVRLIDTLKEEVTVKLFYPILKRGML